MSDDKCWLIENNILEKTEKDCEAPKSSLATAIQKLKIDLVPGPNMGIEKTQKAKEVGKENFFAEEAFDNVYYTSKRVINDAYKRYINDTYVRFVNHRVWN